MAERPPRSRQAVLEAAIAVFARRGYAGTSIQGILAETGLSKPTLYYHFQSKAGLFRAVLDHALDSCFDAMLAATRRHTPGKTQLVAIATALFEYTTSHANLTRLLFASVFAAPGEIPAECLAPTRRRRHFEFVRERLAEARQAGVIDARLDPDDLTHGFVGAISHRIRSHLLLPEGRLDHALATRVVNLFLEGAQPHP